MWARKRSAAFDHLWRMKERYADVLAGRLAAAIAYYAFFATFALAMVAYAVLVKVFSGNPDLVADVDLFLSHYFPAMDTSQLKTAAVSIGWVGLVSLVLAGIGWVDAWRSSQRAIWGLDQHPGNFLVLRLTDLGMLIVLGLLMGVSITAVDLLGRLVDRLSDWWVLLTVGSYVLTVLVNSMIGFALVTTLPRVHMTPKRLLPAVGIVGVGITLLNSVGRYFVSRTENNVAYVAVTAAVGLLLYLYLFNQIVLWAVAYAATSTHGKVFDLAWGRPRKHHLDWVPPGDAASATAAEAAADGSEALEGVDDSDAPDRPKAPQKQDKPR
ncbi:YhjD/YihY/BrkB family envelope integrity protein [Catellatospora sp. KI3]|uniref:YhjD/YihY/BrkB family envelope integrity protein n=1 Tax=Catellatospora sp. KI3 TaxID=3041620 RepID=UPI002482E82C|nr:YhjD/YihY/BrkB family envelope integrity protein [Catellatospora sp. KI3]MDI1459980.1 YhjD/YihY/BrkB family envelope integrity protein [Catellatospora sp. KI3]